MDFDNLQEAVDMQRLRTRTREYCDQLDAGQEVIGE